MQQKIHNRNEILRTILRKYSLDFNTGKTNHDVYKINWKKNDLPFQLDQERPDYR